MRVCVCVYAEARARGIIHIENQDKFKADEIKKEKRTEKNIEETDWHNINEILTAAAWSWLTENFTLTSVFRYNVEHIFRLHHLFREGEKSRRRRKKRMMKI